MLNRIFTMLVVCLALSTGVLHAGQTPPTNGMTLWLKADSLNLPNGASVGVWNDSSTAGNNATQSTTANQPVFRNDPTARINGLPIVRFDGNRFMRLAPGYANFSTGFSGFTVLKAGDAPFGYPRIWWANNTQWNPANGVEPPGFIPGEFDLRIDWVGLLEENQNQQWRYEVGPNAPFTAIDTPTGYQYNVTHFNGLLQRAGTAGTASPMTRTFLDGNLTTPNRSSTGVGIPRNVVRNYVYLGAGESAGARLYGDLSEIILYNRELSEAERIVVSKYMNAKWGVTPPYAEDDAIGTSEDQAVNYDLLANDFTGIAFQIAVTQPTGGAGSVTVQPNNVVTFTPTPNWNGVTTFTYTVTDLNSSMVSTPATVTVTVNSVNDLPAARNDAFTTLEDTPLNIPLSSVLANDSDPIEGSVVSVVNVVSPSSGGGSVILMGGSILYTPAANFSGIDTFQYQITDGSGGFALALVTITVNNADNDAPLAVDDSFSVGVPVFSVAAPGVMLNDEEFENQPMTAILLSQPTMGSVTLNADGSFTYTPNAGFVTGSDFFTYQLSDGTSLSNIATVNLVVFLDSDGDGVPDRDDDDQDNDGFPDDIEVAVGTSPINVLSTPFGGAAAGPRLPFVVQKLQIKLNFAKALSDMIAVKGTLPLPNGAIVAGQPAIFSVGGVAEGFQLDAKGMGTSTRNAGFKVRMKRLRTFGQQNVTFDVKFTKGTFNMKLVDEGLGNQDVKNLAKLVRVDVVFNHTFFQAYKTIRWSAKHGFAGIGK